MTHPTSFRFSDMTSRQLERLVEATGNTRTEVVSMALDRMHREECKEMTMYDSFFGTDEETVLEIYDSLVQGLKDYVASDNYDNDRYKEMLVAKDAYYLKHREVIVKNSDSL